MTILFMPRDQEDINANFRGFNWPCARPHVHLVLDQTKLSRLTLYVFM